MTSFNIDFEKRKESASMASDVERYLKRGGSINLVPKGVSGEVSEAAKKAAKQRLIGARKGNLTRMNK